MHGLHQQAVPLLLATKWQSISTDLSRTPLRKPLSVAIPKANLDSKRRSDTSSDRPPFISPLIEPDTSSNRPSITSPLFEPDTSSNRPPLAQPITSPLIEPYSDSFANTNVGSKLPAYSSSSLFADPVCGAPTGPIAAASWYAARANG